MSTKMQNDKKLQTTRSCLLQSGDSVWERLEAFYLSVLMDGFFSFNMPMLGIKRTSAHVVQKKTFVTPLNNSTPHNYCNIKISISSV